MQFVMKRLRVQQKQGSEVTGIVNWRETSGTEKHQVVSTICLARLPQPPAVNALVAAQSSIFSLALLFKAAESGKTQDTSQLLLTREHLNQSKA